jgi:hypothetical protein
MSVMVRRLLTAVHAADAVPRLRAYFSQHPGRHFDALGGGGDRPEVRDRVTAEDLLAVQMRGPALPGDAAAMLLEGPLARRVSDLLGAIPTSVALDDREAASLIGERSQARLLHEVVGALDGVGPGVAGALVARKRPRLVPVHDEVVHCLLERPPEPWVTLHHALRAHAGVLDQVGVLQEVAGVPEHVPRLRVLDALLWTSHVDEHRTGKRALR